MYYVYVMQRIDTAELYIGYTKDLQRRYTEHKRKFPDRLIYYEAYRTESPARLRERKLKHYGSVWRALKKRIIV